jgi:hypothetical protein
MAEDRDLVDLVVVIGSSLQVQPVSLIPFNVDESIPQILINKEDLPSYSADIKLLGDCDSIIVALCMAIGGKFKDFMLNGMLLYNYSIIYGILELKSRSSDMLVELESLLTSNPDCIYPAVISEEEIRRQFNEDIPNEDSEEDVPTKRQKLDNDESSDSQKAEIDMLRKMYAANLIAVGSKLKGHTYTKVKMGF